MARLRRWTALCAALLPLASVAEEGPSAAALAAARWLRPDVKTLSRPIEVYHYAYRPAIRLPAQGPVKADAAFISTYLQRKGARFWDEAATTRPHAMPSGLYAAIDPVISRTFGGIGESWALFQLTLPAGLRLVDVRGWSDNAGSAQRFPPAQRQGLAKAGCDVEFPSELLVAQSSLACRKLALEVMRALDVDGLMYRYQGFEFEGCRGRSVGGFILTRPGRVQRALLLTSESPGPKAASEAHLRVRQLYLEARGAGSFYPAPWPDLEGRAAPGDMLQWKKAHLFGCGGHAEDRMPGEERGTAAQPDEEARK